MGKFGQFYLKTDDIEHKYVSKIQGVSVEEVTDKIYFVLTSFWKG